MKMIEIQNNKKEYLPLLLIGDEQESMIDKYIDRGRMFAVDDDGVKAICVVTDEDNGIIEIKNIAILPDFQRRGYGRILIDFISDKFSDTHSTLQVGTGDSPLTIPFYEKCGFTFAYKIKNFFTDNYDHPILECGRQLVDMVYMQKQI